MIKVVRKNWHSVRFHEILHHKDFRCWETKKFFHKKKIWHVSNRDCKMQNFWFPEYIVKCAFARNFVVSNRIRHTTLPGQSYCRSWEQDHFEFVPVFLRIFDFEKRLKVTINSVWRNHESKTPLGSRFWSGFHSNSIPIYQWMSMCSVGRWFQ